MVSICVTEPIKASNEGNGNSHKICCRKRGSEIKPESVRTVEGAYLLVIIKIELLIVIQSILKNIKGSTRKFIDSIGHGSFFSSLSNYAVL